MGSAREKLDSAGHEKVDCKVCGLWFHRLDVHVNSQHSMTIDRYKEMYPGAQTISTWASANARKARAEKIEPVVSAPTATKVAPVVSAPLEAGVLQFGTVRLQRRTDLKSTDAAFVPVHNPLWSPFGVNEKAMWEYIALGVSQNENVLLVGETGLGKSTGVEQLANVLNQPVRKINLHGDVRAADFLGETQVVVDPTTGQAITSWADGILPDAMRRGHWLLLDELDAAPAAILFVLQGVLEPGHKLVLTGNKGEVVEPHPNFRILATANTLGRGDDSGLYAGTNVLNEAFLDRWAVVIRCVYPDPVSEAKILVAYSGIIRKMADDMVSVANRVREAKAHETCYCTFSLRRLIAWATKTAQLGDVRKAAQVTVVNKLSGDDAKMVSDLIQRQFGGAL
jgi:cobaltochelatase CobS